MRCRGWKSTRRRTRCAPTVSASRARPRASCRWRNGISCFEMAASVPVITRAHTRVGQAELSGLEGDALVLTAEERRWERRRVTTRGGRVLQLVLPTGSLLVPGEILHVDDGWYVRIEAASEAVLAIKPASSDEAVRIAFEVGNRHFTLAIDGDRLL